MTVKSAVSAGNSVAVLSTSVTVPEVQVRLTMTPMVLSSLKSLATLKKVEELRVLVMVQLQIEELGLESFWKDD